MNLNEFKVAQHVWHIKSIKYYKIGLLTEKATLIKTGGWLHPDIPLTYTYQAFIQTLLSTAIFSLRLRFFLLFAKSVNLCLQIAGKCISDTLFDFKAYVVHQW